ncbi:hypothetical protein R1flu_009557 [Riccia fluitans]|uniref:Uncharacterized protein n=1 Tax=Riccia fluitans TaxID=41844 RepID=A0ABD1Z2F6_9MARC
MVWRPKMNTLTTGKGGSTHCRPRLKEHRSGGRIGAEEKSIYSNSRGARFVAIRGPRLPAEKSLAGKRDAIGTHVATRRWNSPNAMSNLGKIESPSTAISGPQDLGREGQIGHPTLRLIC